MTWIESISRETATGYLKRLYRAYQRPNRTIANIYRAHSLRPHTLEGHTALNRAVLSHVASYFAYAHRVVLGLGVTLDGEVRAEQTEIPFRKIIIPEPATKTF